MWDWKVISGIVATGVILLWILLNNEVVEVNFLLFSTHLPVWVVIITSTVLGATAVFAVRVFMASRARKKKEEEEKKE